MKRLTTLVAALVATSGILAASPTGAALGASPNTATAVAWAGQPIVWHGCTDPELAQAGATCGMLTVPLDYDHPAGAKIHLAVSRVRHTVPESQYQGVMLVNPGGPGASGLTLATLGSFVPDNAGDAYDWIGFDPRGVGDSQPALSCDPNYFQGPRPPYDPTTPAIEQAWLSRTSDYAADCQRNGGPLLSHVKTIDTVNDMDSLRRALGRDQISFYGFSYGTYLGQVYATKFPDRVRRMVLDSNVDPRKVWYQANLDQDPAFEKVLTKWWAWIAKYDSVYHLGSTESAVENLWYDTRDKLEPDPAGGVVGPAEWTDIFTPAGYSQFTWVDLGNLFSDWVHQADPQPLVDAYSTANGVGDNEYAMYLAVQCTDAPWPSSWTTWRRDNTRIAKAAPFLTWANAWYNAPCRVWPAPVGQPVKVNGRAAPPILLIDETLDAATPFTGSLTVRKLFPRSSLIALPGGTNHAASLFGDTCLDTKIAAYLASGALPERKSGDRADVTCAPLPTPVPTATAASTTAGVDWATARPTKAPLQRLR